MKGSRTHHVNGCGQAMVKQHAPRFGPPLRMGDPGIEWWCKPERTLVRVIGPKEGCVENWDKVDCCNCLGRREKAERDGPRWMARNK